MSKRAKNPNTMVVCQQKHLKKTERASSEVEKNVTNAPALCALSFVVHPGLKKSIFIIQFIQWLQHHVAPSSTAMGEERQGALRTVEGGEVQEKR